MIGALLAWTAASAPAASSRPCATISVDGSRVIVRVAGAAVRCGTAQQVMSDFLSGDWVQRDGGTFVSGGWLCAHRTPLSPVCRRGGTTIEGRIVSTGTLDPPASELARTAQTAAETYATDHNPFSYAGLSIDVLHQYEPSIWITPRHHDAYVSVGEAIDGGNGYVVAATATVTGDSYTITRVADGSITRTCTLSGGARTGGECQGGSW
jgi:hypothetical protein